jgi:hypothetical protein
MTEEEVWKLDELLTKTTPEVDTNVQGPFMVSAKVSVTKFPINFYREKAPPLSNGRKA